MLPLGLEMLGLEYGCGDSSRPGADGVGEMFGRPVEVKREPDIDLEGKSEDESLMSVEIDDGEVDFAKVALGCVKTEARMLATRMLHYGGGLNLEGDMGLGVWEGLGSECGGSEASERSDETDRSDVTKETEKPTDTREEEGVSEEVDDEAEKKRKLRRKAIERFRAKRANRSFEKRVRYACRKQLADSRPRVKGRFVKKSEMRLYLRFGPTYRKYLYLLDKDENDWDDLAKSVDILADATVPQQPAHLDHKVELCVPMSS